MQQSRSLMPRTTSLIEAIAFFGLPGAQPVTTDRTTWVREVDQVIAYRLSSLGLAAARSAGIAESDLVIERLRAGTVRGTLRTALVQGLASASLGALRRLDIPFAVTKGPGIARLYGQPDWRPFRDVDVLVRPRDFRLAKLALETLDFVEPPSFRQPRSYFDRFCREGVNLLRPDGGAIDLHHHVPPWIWGKLLRPERLIECAEEVAGPGGSLPLAAPFHNLLVTALHVISDRGHGGHELLMWRDLVTIANRCDVEAVAREARQTKLDWLLALVLRALPTGIQPSELLDALGEPRQPRMGQLRLRNLVPPARLAKHQIARAFRYPAPNAAAFLVGFGIPSQAFLKQRYGRGTAYAAWWRDASSGLRDATKIKLPQSRKAPAAQ